MSDKSLAPLRRPLARVRRVVDRGIVAAALAAGISGGALAQSREYVCSEGSKLKIDVEDADTLAVRLGSDEPRRLHRSGTALDYAAGPIALHLSQNQRSVRISRSGVDDTHCIYPVPAVLGAGGGDVKGVGAKSWGGVVRAGPGMDFPKLASLREGDRIILEERTNEMMNGYPWFRITYGKAESGFQWGGIICAVGEPVAGTFQQCD